MPQQHIARIRAYLEEAAAAGDAEARALLAELDEQEPERMIDRYRDEALRWQASHPELSRLLGRVADLLSAEGI